MEEVAGPSAESAEVGFKKEKETTERTTNKKKARRPTKNDGSESTECTSSRKNNKIERRVPFFSVEEESLRPVKRKSRKTATKRRRIPNEAKAQNKMPKANILAKAVVEVESDRVPADFLELLRVFKSFLRGSGVPFDKIPTRAFGMTTNHGAPEDFGEKVLETKRARPTWNLTAIINWLNIEHMKRHEEQQQRNRTRYSWFSAEDIVYVRTEELVPDAAYAYVESTDGVVYVAEGSGISRNTRPYTPLEAFLTARRQERE